VVAEATEGTAGLPVRTDGMGGKDSSNDAPNDDVGLNALTPVLWRLKNDGSGNGDAENAEVVVAPVG
jgi:hypothetical protein